MYKPIPLGPKDFICPFHKKSMDKVCHTCPLWAQVRGQDPQSKKEIDQWNCSLGWLPMLIIENAKVGRETGAAVESFRNEVVARQVQRPINELGQDTIIETVKLIQSN